MNIFKKNEKIKQDLEEADFNREMLSITERLPIIVGKLERNNKCGLGEGYILGYVANIIKPVSLSKILHKKKKNKIKKKKLKVLSVSNKINKITNKTITPLHI